MIEGAFVLPVVIVGNTEASVADASVFPTITTGNTNAPSIMVGEKASDLIKLDE